MNTGQSNGSSGIDLRASVGVSLKIAALVLFLNGLRVALDRATDPYIVRNPLGISVQTLVDVDAKRAEQVKQGRDAGPDFSGRTVEYLSPRERWVSGGLWLVAGIVGGLCLRRLAQQIDPRG